MDTVHEIQHKPPENKAHDNTRQERKRFGSLLGLNTEKEEERLL